MKFLPYHKDGLTIFKAIEYDTMVNGWHVIDTDADAYCLYGRHGAMSFTKSDLLFAKLNTIAVFDKASEVDCAYIKHQVAAIPIFGDDALQRIATNIVDHSQLLDIEPHGMALPLRRSLLAFAAVFDGIEIQ